jgi:hypothetical protein
VSFDKALIRLEFKLDLIIQALQSSGVILPTGHIPPLEGITEDLCPVCGKPIRLSLDMVNEQVIRECGCKLPVSVVPGISKLLKPQGEPDDHSGRTAEEGGVLDEEEAGSSRR